MQDPARAKEQASVIRQEYQVPILWPTDSPSSPPANPVMLVTVSNYTPPPSRKKKGALNDRAADKAKERERKRRSGPTANGAPTRSAGSSRTRGGKQPAVAMPSKRSSSTSSSSGAAAAAAGGGGGGGGAVRGTTPRGSRRSSEGGASRVTTPGTRRRASSDGAGPAKKSNSNSNGAKVRAAVDAKKGKKKSGKKEARRKKVVIKVFLNGHPKVDHIEADATSCISQGDSMKAIFTIIEKEFEQYPKRFKAIRLLARDLETVIANGHELQDGGHYLMCGNESPYATKLPAAFKPTVHLSNSDWAVLEKQYGTVEKKSIRFLKKTFDLHDIDGSESLDIEEIARALSFVHGRGTYNQGEILSFIKPLVDEFDHNKDGEMCFEEFMDFWLKSQSPPSKGDSKALIAYRQKAKDAEKEDVDDGKSKACIIM